MLSVHDYLVVRGVLFSFLSWLKPVGRKRDQRNLAAVRESVLITRVHAYVLVHRLLLFFLVTFCVTTHSFYFLRGLRTNLGRPKMSAIEACVRGTEVSLIF